MSDAVDRFFSGYYRDPSPALAVAALEQAFGSEGLQNSAVVMFVRAVQLHPDVRAAFEGLAHPAAAQIVAHADDPRLPDPNTMPLGAPADLDVLWAEFLLTGSEAPVRRIASVLDREERVRPALIAWAAAAPWTPWGRSAHTRAVAALAEQGLAPDAPGDLDLTLWARMAAGLQVRTAAPFVDDTTIAHIAMKGVACWSLQSNARQHEIVAGVVAGLPGRDRWPALG